MSVVHCKKEAFDVYIGRPSNWGNPFVIGRDGTRKVGPRTHLTQCSYLILRDSEDNVVEVVGCGYQNISVAGMRCAITPKRFTVEGC